MTRAPDNLFLWATVGLPASGKSTFARDVAQEGAAHGCSIVLASKDELRLMLHDGRWNKENEKMTEAAEQAIVERALFEGRNVIVHDTNLAPRHLIAWAAIAGCFRQVNFRVISFLDVPFETCIQRDAQRTDKVGEAVIMRMVRDQLENGKREQLEKLFADQGWLT
jgi:predicted kinase